MYFKNEEDIFKTLNSNIDGLDSKEAKKRLNDYGQNIILNKNKTPLILRFLKQFNDTMIIILLVVAVLLYFYGCFYSHEYTDTIVILFVVFINAIVGFIQEEKSALILKDLKKYETSTSKVKRDDKILIINTKELVPGDIIYLESGETVPADIRILRCENLKVDESALTGESIPVQKSADVLKENLIIQEQKNMLFLGTNITNGKCTGIVVSTGKNSELGKIALSLNEIDRIETPLQLKIKELSKKITLIVFVILIFIFILALINKYTILEIIMLCSSLAVAAIPEGLPTVITITLSVGISNLAKKKTVVKQMQAVETLGAIDIICSDKTGTITQNKMTVKDEYVIDEKMLNYICALCNDGLIYKDKYVGDPTETCLYDYLYNKKINSLNLRKKCERLLDVPFDSDRKMFTTLNKIDDNVYVLCKGSMDSLIEKVNLSKTQKKEVLDKVKNFSKNALRTLGFAYKKLDYVPKNIKELEKEENNLFFAGILGMIDPPRKSVKESVALCKNAGIRPIMITGDGIDTATTIAKDVGIITSDNEAILGSELDKYNDKELEDIVKKYSVYARVNPTHKEKIVFALQSSGKIVAMTGDGVNDAPAIKDAHVGVGMGITGTDVTKSASDIVLMDDSFSTIVVAIEEGRRIYNNIRNNIVFSLSSNFAEIFTIIIGLFTKTTILLPIYILFIDLVTDSIPSICLSFEKSEDGIMNKKPRGINKPLFTPFIKASIAFSAIIETLFVVLTYFISLKMYGQETAMSLALLSMVIQEIVYSLSCRNLKQSVVKQGLFSNKAMNYGLLLIILIELIVFITPVGKLISVTSINISLILVVFLINFMAIFIYELIKPLLVKCFKD
ncbi:cation-transporting P-type ATPase [human gut metagenome]|uniref:Cation-transporting P-type ATPase n=1 Tax=human gut metagenome TaxID=408170 RepID=K1RJQ6_9ZZZZ